MSTMNWSTLHELEERMYEALDKGHIEQAKMLKRSHAKMREELRKKDSPMRSAFGGIAKVFAPLMLVLLFATNATAQATAKQVKSVEGEWVLHGEHPSNVPSAVYIVAAQDSARISAVTGHEVLIARYYFKGGILVPLAGNPNLWVVEKYPGHRISLTDSVGNVAVYSRAPVDQ